MARSKIDRAGDGYSENGRELCLRRSIAKRTGCAFLTNLLVPDVKSMNLVNSVEVIADPRPIDVIGKSGPLGYAQLTSVALGDNAAQCDRSCNERWGNLQ
jgi:hypothetical protein